MFARLRRRPNAAFTVVLGVSLALTSASYSSAQTDPDELARRHFESGAAYFEQAEYEAALREFEKAYELSRRPQILRNISVVQERMGDIAGAIVSLDHYLESAPNDPDIETIRIRRDNLKKRLEQEQPEEAVPPPEVKEEPKPEKQEPEPPPPDDSAPLPPEAEPNLVPAYVLITIGGLAGVGSGVTGYLAAEEHKKLEGSCGASSGCSDDDTAQGETLALTSTVLTGVAVLGVGIGVIWWATADSNSERASASVVPDVSLGFGTEGGFGEARWRF